MAALNEQLKLIRGRMFQERDMFFMLAGLIAMLTVVLIKLPSAFMDVLLVINIMFSVVLFMTVCFLKSPLEFSRVTSGFTYARPHPILGGVRPHLAIDYGAPVGTPVRAVADGVVVHAGWNGGNGIQVHLRHRSGYETQYNHLSRISEGLRPGVRVRQKQIIGNVGATGLATGPHLDYRVARNGTFVNPLSEKFIPGEPIPAATRPDFTRHARELVARLEAAAPF